ncbi:hypothetical protein [Streptomyces sp. NBC_01216]|uniref:hypothetical protein n=1 Tax=Streptomyces sp. NBC_01216 TaxID=2903778 RepID=UPI003FA3D466
MTAADVCRHAITCDDGAEVVATAGIWVRGGAAVAGEPAPATGGPGTIDIVVALPVALTTPPSSTRSPPRRRPRCGLIGGSAHRTRDRRGLPTLRSSGFGVSAWWHRSWSSLVTGTRPSLHRG